MLLLLLLFGVIIIVIITFFRKRLPVNSVRCGQTASFALRKVRRMRIHFGDTIINICDFKVFFKVATTMKQES